MGQQRERRLIAEWAKETHPRDRVILNCPIGPPATELVAIHGIRRAMEVSKPWRMKADAVVITERRLILAEAKIYNIRDAVGDLLVYRPLVSRTPELQQYWGLDVQMVMVVPWITEWVREIAGASSVEVSVFAPEWVLDYIEEHHKYWSSEYKMVRENVMATRRALGVE